jgi:catechol 2,3-dioxygenase-like lactoylglutathione lyase family enzyme
MNQLQVGQKSYEMPPQEGLTIAHFIVVADIERSARFYEKVFGARILSRGDSKGAPGYLQIANTWLIVNVGGGPTPGKPTVTLSVPADPDRVSSFMNIRVADVQACYELWRSRGAEFITEPKPKYGETRCYIRDPDGYIIEVGQSNPAHRPEASGSSLASVGSTGARTGRSGAFKLANAASRISGGSLVRSQTTRSGLQCPLMIQLSGS